MVLWIWISAVAIILQLSSGINGFILIVGMRREHSACRFCALLLNKVSHSNSPVKSFLGTGLERLYLRYTAGQNKYTDLIQMHLCEIIIKFNLFYFTL